MQTVAISGSSGFLGSALAVRLAARGVRVRPLVRPGKSATDGIAWDPSQGTVDEKELATVDAIVHLAGENLGAKRWNEAQKAKIIDSRVIGTRGLAQAVARMQKLPAVFLSASGIGYYGDTGEAVIDEQAGAGSDFLAQLSVAWEDATREAHDAGVRVVIPRIGVVLDPSGGALEKMGGVFRLGLGGRIGSGKQYMSWISLEDMLRVLEHLLTRSDLSGAFNACAPAPVTNQELTRALADALHRPAFLPLPSFAARLALGEMADAALLGGTRAQPARLLASGFRFEHPELAPFLSKVFDRTSSAAHAH